jgi:hypothetical protein
MRKRIVPASAGTVTAALTLVLLVAACDRTSDTPKSASVGSAVAVDGLAAIGEASAPVPTRAMMAQREETVAGGRAVGIAPPAEATASSAAANDSRAVQLGNPLPPMDPSGAMLIRNGQATVQVTRLDDGVAKLRQTAAQLGGFVANTSILGGKDEHRSASLEIRVPSAQFDAVITALGGLGKVETVSASVQDVGDEYVDLGARVANARHMEARLVEMLARRTGKLSEALTVEQELRRVREEIERYDARLKWLERRTALSSIQITLHEPTSVLDQRGPSPIAEAFAEAWRRAVGVVAWCIATLGVLVPLGLLIGGFVMIVRRLPRLRGAS